MTQTPEMREAIARLERVARNEVLSGWPTESVYGRVAVWRDPLNADIKTVLSALCAPSPVEGGGEPTREEIGKAIYLAMYESQGAVWIANDSKETWFEIGDRFLAQMKAPTSPPQATNSEVERLTGLINRELRSFELNGGNILDAIATYHGDKTVKEALEIVGDWSAWLAHALAQQGEKT